MRTKQVQKNGIISLTQIILFLSCSFFLLSSVYAAEISGVTFPEYFQDENVQMQLQGVGIKSFAFFKVCAAGFYREESNNKDILDDVPKHLEVSYFVRIPGTKLSKFTTKIMKHNVSASEFQQLQEKIKIMNNYFVDLKPGDRFALTYIPETGCKFVFNGKLIGMIEGASFSRALFSVWIGSKPFDQRLKSKILGLHKK